MENKWIPVSERGEGEMTLFGSNGAEFSQCRKYRYALWRIWDDSKPLVMFIGLNPSTANENDNDPTIRRVVKFASDLGYGGVYMMNCFPLVSTNPAYLNEFFETPFHEVEDVENMRWLLDVSKKCKEVIFAWGAFQEAKERGKSLARYFKNAKALIINKDGSPRHPLYVKGDVQPIPYNKSGLCNSKQVK